MNDEPNAHRDTPMVRAWAIANDINYSLGLPALTYGEMRDVWATFVHDVNAVGYKRQREAIRDAGK